MYSKVTRSEEYKHYLLDFIKHEYGIESIGIKPAKRGFYGETWKLTTATAEYFLKVVYAPEHKPFYERSLPVVQHLCDHGIDFVGRIIKTQSNKLHTQFDGATIAVFDWIEGENEQTETTKIKEYNLLAKVYTVPTDSIIISSEDFTNKDADDFFERWSRLEDKPVLFLLENNRSKIEHRAKRLNIFSEVCRNDTSGFVITHGDAGGNFVVSGETDFIVDWDTVKLAPPERDAWFCVHWDWAMAGFRDALKVNGINYKLRNERFAYYCYWFFFYYLNAFLDARSEVGTVEEYINGWMTDNVKWADEISPI